MSQQDLDNALMRLKTDTQYSVYMAVAGILDRIEPKKSEMSILKVAILRNFTFEPIIPVIKAEIAQAGFFPQVYIGNFDTIAQDVLNPNSAFYEFQPNIIILAQWLDTLTPALVSKFPLLTMEQVKIEIERLQNTSCEFIEALRKRVNVPILINNFPLPTYPALGILDAQSKNYQIQVVLKLNYELLDYAEQSRDVYLVDYMSLMARIGSEQGLDIRYWQIGRAPIGKKALVPFGREYGKFIRSLKGKSRKCLVLDCDNILWGGIIGEDGMKGIQLGKNYPGSCFQAFQQEILNLHDRGIIITLCSKNNEEDVLEVFKNHPEMILKVENLSTWQINWNDKASNIKHIAQELNIGLDSLVFVDDNQFECDLVREQLPQVAVLHLNSEPSGFCNKLHYNAYFDNLTFSTEDQNRNRMYRDQIKRKQLSESTSSLEEYLSRLEMEVEIGLVDETSILRVAQLTQKTNQFNLTTKRYTTGDIQTFMENPNTDVFFLSLRDKIADMGLIGVAILIYKGNQVIIDTFLLSCRAIGRGVEDTFLATILEYIKNKGVSEIKSEYIISKKNSQVKDYYKKMGFTLKAESNNGSEWQLSLKNNNLSAPSWIMIKQNAMETNR